MLKYVNVRRHVTSSFKAVTRDAWDETHASKSRAPELGRYRPKHQVVDRMPDQAAIREEHRHIGRERIQEKLKQQSHFCERVVKAVTMY